MAVTTDNANDLMVLFSNTISSGFDALTGAVTSVFGLMIALVVALTGLQWALSANREVLASGLGKVLLIGFFAYVINDWQSLSETIWNGFAQLGLTAGGGTLSRADFLNPGAILYQGWSIVKALGETPAPVENPLDVMGNLTDALILGLAMIGIMLAFVVLALQIIVTLLEFKIVTLGGFILLPFGIWSKSAFLAERPLGFVAASGLKVLALAIVVSGARSVFDQLQPSANPDLYEALAILAAALLLAMLAIFIPNLAAALVTGGPSLGAGAAVTGGLAVAGAGAVASAATIGLGTAAARIAGASRAAAGAGHGRPPPSPPPQPPRPSNDNGRGPDRGPSPQGRSRAHTAAGRWSRVQDASSARAPASSAAEGHAGGRSPQGGPAREQGRAGAAQAVSNSVMRSSQGEVSQDVLRQERRNAAVRAFFAANAGRSLLPTSETSGAIAPHLKNEEP